MAWQLESMLGDFLAVCAVTNIMTTLIFIIVSRLHAFVVVSVRSFLHVLVAVAVISYFQHTPAVRSNDICLSLNLLSLSVVITT